MLWCSSILEAGRNPENVTPRTRVGLLGDGDICATMVLLYNQLVTGGSGVGQESNSWICCRSPSPHPQHLVRALS